MYMAQLSTGLEAVQFYTRGIELMKKAIADEKANEVVSFYSGLLIKILFELFIQRFLADFS